MEKAEGWQKPPPAFVLPANHAMQPETVGREGVLLIVPL